MTLFRIAQYLYAKKIWWRLAPFVVRCNQFLTDFECHLGAEIGEGLFIPHAHDIVIGQGTIIGRNVTIYNGVTLGAKILKKFDPTFEEGQNRYPIVEDDVAIYTGAKLIGPIRIGKQATVGVPARVLD